jgi:hypothetical protein
MAFNPGTIDGITLVTLTFTYWSLAVAVEHAPATGVLFVGLISRLVRYCLAEFPPGRELSRSQNVSRTRCELRAGA